MLVYNRIKKDEENEKKCLFMECKNLFAQTTLGESTSKDLKDLGRKKFGNCAHSFYKSKSDFLMGEREKETLSSGPRQYIFFF